MSRETEKDREREKRIKRLLPKWKTLPTCPLTPNMKKMIATSFWRQLTWFDGLEVWIALGKPCSYCGAPKPGDDGSMNMISLENKVMRLCPCCLEICCKEAKIRYCK
ncbi:hypothetical protein ES703_27228 [subsurface metagenome]